MVEQGVTHAATSVAACVTVGLTLSQGVIRVLATAVVVQGTWAGLVVT